MRTWLLLVVAFASCSGGKTKCDHVNTGDFYANGEPVNFFGFRDSSSMEREITINPDCANYMFQPTDPKGALCISSWTKLYGSSRCGYLHAHHEDSDRFVWRRHIDCLILNGSHVIGTVPNCPKANLIQLSAYAYDKGNIPYQNASLEALFNFAVEVGQNYTYNIIFTPTEGVYTLYSSLESGRKFIESHTIKHTPCDEWDHGYVLGLYFGGECPAPQYVSICYEDDKFTRKRDENHSQLQVLQEKVNIN